jgi:hypothetical protein
MDLNVSGHSLLIFVDDTGHEALVPGHPVYGLGGCVVMAGDLERVIRHPWYELRRQVRGSADTWLHAAALGHPPSDTWLHAAALGHPPRRRGHRRYRPVLPQPAPTNSRPIDPVFRTETVVQAISVEKDGICGWSTPGSDAANVVLLSEVLKRRWRGPTPPLRVTFGERGASMSFSHQRAATVTRQ